MPYNFVGRITLSGERNWENQSVEGFVGFNLRVARDMCLKDGINPDEAEIHFGRDDVDFGYTAQTRDEMGEYDLPKISEDYLRNANHRRVNELEPCDFSVGVYVETR